MKNNVLLELSKRNKDWLKVAKHICGCKDKAKDLVQDMYLSIGTTNPILKEKYDLYIFRVLQNIHKQKYKKNKTYIKNKKRITVEFVEYNTEIL